jgi:hypothetical protein
MGLSDAEIEMRLAALRRQREALDREIADLVLYQELGRRLGAVRAGADTHGPDAEPGSAPISDQTRARDTRPAPHPAPARAVPADPAPVATRTSGQGIAPTGWPASGLSEARATLEAIPPAIAFTEDVAGARRYGRALVEAACTALARAGRPSRIRDRSISPTHRPPPGRRWPRRPAGGGRPDRTASTTGC